MRHGRDTGLKIERSAERTKYKYTEFQEEYEVLLCGECHVENNENNYVTRDLTRETQLMMESY